MLVSVIVPACAAEKTIGRCVVSLLAQSYRCWEAVVVADDRRDYAALLAGDGIVDPRLRFVSTGAVRSGCHNARNIGLSAASGEIIAHLDADDLYDPHRLTALAPLAAAHGAVVDRVAVVSDEDRRLYTAPSCGLSSPRLSATALLDLGVPLSPLLRRSLAAPRLAGIEYAEDVIANLQLIERLGALPVFPQALYRYCVVPGSLSHDESSGARFDAAYSTYLTRLRSGDGFGLIATRAAALRGFARKRALNRLFIDARRRQPGLTFQHFMARHRGLASHAFATVARPAPAGIAALLASARQSGKPSNAAL